MVFTCICAYIVVVLAVAHLMDTPDDDEYAYEPFDDEF